mgnify:FL=1
MGENYRLPPDVFKFLRGFPSSFHDLKKPSLSLAKLRALIESGIVATSSKTSILAFLDLAHVAVGRGAFYAPAVLASPETFSIWFPLVSSRENVKAYGDATLYSRCRNSLHRHVRLADAWPVEDPFFLLNQLAREYLVPPASRNLIETVFPEISLRTITREMDIAADCSLQGGERSSLGKTLSTIDRL